MYSLTAPLLTARGFVTTYELPHAMVRPRLTVKRIQDVVSSYYHITPHEMTSERQAREVVIPRHVAMYLARQMTFKSLPSIGRLFNRDHTTVMHGIRRVKGMMADSPDFAMDVNILRERLAA